MGHRVEGAAHGVAGQRGQAGGVHLVAQVVEHVVVGQHVGLILGGNGDLIGIVNAKSSDTNSEGLGFAIPSNTALKIAKELINKSN